MTELQRCPFCGSGDLHIGKLDGGKLCHVKCFGCEACGPLAQTPAAARDKWQNRRRFVCHDRDGQPVFERDRVKGSTGESGTVKSCGKTFVVFDKPDDFGIQEGCESTQIELLEAPHA